MYSEVSGGVTQVFHHRDCNDITFTRGMKRFLARVDRKELTGTGSAPVGSLSAEDGSKVSGFDVHLVIDERPRPAFPSQH